MRNLKIDEMNLVSGGESFEASSYDVFWKSFSQASGWGAGYILSIPMAAGMIVYGAAYYAIYTPIYYVGYGIGSGCSYVYDAIVN